MNGWRRRAAEIDLALFERAADRPSPLLDRVLPRLTRAANHSGLWLGAAAALAALGGKRGRSAAIRGVAGLALASAIANVPAKFGARRHRPPLDRVPLARQLGRQPRTFSFPSGHSASAAGFATGVTLEHPAIGLPVVALAAGVAYSRVHVGVHYPSDIAVGVAIGLAAGLVTLRPWPRGERRISPAPERTSLEGTRPGGVVIVVNPGAGPDDRTAEAVEEAFPDASIHVLDEDGDLEAALEQAAERADVLGMAGGDGSVRAAATIAARVGMRLLVIPGGTRNHLAAELGITTVEDAAAALDAGTLEPMDLGVAGDLRFVNTLVFGDYPRMVELRERLSDEISEWPASIVAVARTLRDSSPLEIEIDGQRRRVWLLFIGNGRYDEAGFTDGWRENLADGLLDVRLIDADRRFARSRLVAALVTGRLGASPVQQRRLVEHVRIAGLEGVEHVAHDGDAAEAPTELEVTKQRRAVEVFTARPARQG